MGITQPRSFTYEDLDAHLGNKASRAVANNTRANRNEDGSIGVVLHATEILVVRHDGEVTMRTGGWQTLTTKERLNRALPGRQGVSQDRGVWYFATWPDGADVTKVPFFEGMTVDTTTGVVVNAGQVAA